MKMCLHTYAAGMYENHDVLKVGSRKNRGKRFLRGYYKEHYPSTSCLGSPCHVLIMLLSNCTKPLIWVKKGSIAPHDRVPAAYFHLYMYEKT